MIVAERIRQAIEDSGLSQSEIARRVRVTQQTIAKLASGETTGSRYLHRIARELQTTPAYLTGETDDPHGEGGDEAPLTSEEQELLDHYRAIEPKERAAIMTLARSLATNARSPTVHSKGQQFRGASTAAVGGPK